MNHVPQDAVDAVHQADVATDGHVAMLRRRRQLTREITRNGVRARAKIAIERLARLEARFLIGGQPILSSEARRRMGLILAYQSRARVNAQARREVEIS